MATGRSAHRAASWEDFLDEKTGRLKDDLARRRSCPLCFRKGFDPLFVKKGFEHGRCPDCGLIYVNPVLSEAAAAEHYRRESSWVRVLDTKEQTAMDRLKYAYGLDAAEPHLGGRRLLDVGAGTGLFLQVARDRGYEALGLELHEVNSARLRRSGFEIYDRPLEEVDLPDQSPMDLVTLWEVLEHIVDPGPLLARIGRLLAPGGVLLILVPNVDSLVTRILHEKSGTFGGHSHVSHFNVNTLTSLLAQSGFRPY